MYRKGIGFIAGASRGPRRRTVGRARSAPGSRSACGTRARRSGR